MKISTKIGDIFLACGKERNKLLSIARDKIANDLKLLKRSVFFLLDSRLSMYDMIKF